MQTHLSCKSRHFITFAADKCVSLQEEGQPPLPKDVEYIPMKWFETPSIVSLDAGTVCKECNAVCMQLLQ